MTLDAVVVGAGPNGLAAAVELARAGCSVSVFEARETIGGGARSAELTLPGYLHDVCSAIHPMALGSPFLASLPLADHGLAWIEPPSPLAHPFDDGTAAVLERSIERTGETIAPDARSYSALMAPFVRQWGELAGEILSGLHVPRHPLLLARFGLQALRSARALALGRFSGERARGLFAGLGAHSVLALDRRPSAAIGIVLGAVGHALGWPIARGGSQRISDALGSYLTSLGGRIVTGSPVASLADLPRSRAVLCDVTPRQLLRLAGERLPRSYRRALERYRYGPGVFKVDWALGSPIPWTARECARAGTVHLGGTLHEIVESEAAASESRHPEHPFVLLAQQSLFDDTRAPAGRHTAWAYCHVPHGSTVDMTERIESQIERFAPGFRDCILGRHVFSTVQLESYNPNYVGGDIQGGIADLAQTFARPTPRVVPYATPVPGLYLCSASTPPGGGVHGMCGYNAARAALKFLAACR